MAEKPILFSGEMVRAILGGTKTQTRRVVPHLKHDQGRTFIYRNGRVWASMTDDELAPLNEDPPRSVFGGEAIFDRDLAYTPVVVGKGPKGEGNPLVCPYGRTGDRIRLREAWRVHRSYDSFKPRGLPRDAAKVSFEADGVPECAGKYRHARFMPRWASRITLEVTEVRLERLHQITEEDAEAEGFESLATSKAPDWCPECRGAGIVGYDCDHSRDCQTCSTARGRFSALWDKINAKRGYTWDSNPWVWVVSFKVMP